MIVILSGAGISAESGLSTFRDSGGLWEGHDVMSVASPEGWAADSELVNNFYNQRRRDLLGAEPNAAHAVFAKLQEEHEVQIITQNVDDLHERAGSKHVTHLHGELLKVRSTGDSNLVYKWNKDVQKTDVCEKGFALRPHIVWFGEAVPLIEKASELVSQASLVIIIGTSLQVYPAAGLMDYAQRNVPILYIDPNPAMDQIRSRSNLFVIAKKATESLEDVKAFLMEHGFAKS